MAKRSLPARVLSALWNGITRVRLALSNLLFLALLAVIWFVYIGGTPEPLPEQAALLLNLSGTVVDQRSPVDPLQALLVESSPAAHEVLLRDLLDAIEFAADDPAITALVLELDALGYVGISKTQEIVEALTVFRDTGKPVIAVGDYFSQDQYLLASHADEVIVHPLGGVALEGFSSYRNYFKEALDKVSVNVHVFRAGEFKSAVEPFKRNDMSEGEREVTSRWLSNLWKQYASTVEMQRELAPGSVDLYINNFADRLRETRGDAARAALRAGLVDQVMDRSEANEHLISIVGAENDDGLYEAVVFERYVARKRPLSLSGPRGDRVAVITAQGTMLPGEQPPGAIGGDSLARLIRNAVEDDGVGAIVLRIDSGGGSLFASEVIRRQVAEARASGIPVVVSMGAVAASGGYYIAAEADEIWATPSTITGSIGVFAAFPTFEDLLGRIGVHTDGVGTTELAGALRPDRPLDPKLESALNSGVDFAYRSFLEIVARGRGMTTEQVEPLAAGRVWSATEALAVGLVDQLGSLDDAIASAAGLADITGYEVDYREMPLSPQEMLLRQLANRTAFSGWLRNSGVTGNLGVDRILAPVRAAAAELDALADPGHLYLRCIACAGAR